MHTQFNFVQQCIQISTGINSTNVHMYICVCFIRNPVQHIQYSTWCQNRGCICISSKRRTYRLNPVVFCIHSVIQTRNIILQTELFPKKRREKISKERYFNPQELHSTRITTRFQCFHMQSSHPVL